MERSLLEEVKEAIEAGRISDSANPIVPRDDEVSGIIAAGFVWKTEGAGSEDCLVKTLFSPEQWLVKKILDAVEEVLGRLYSESDLQEEGEEEEERARLREEIEPLIRERFDSRPVQWLIPILWSEEDTDRIEDEETDTGDDDWDE